MDAIATVRQFFDLLNAEDYESLRAAFTEDAAWLPMQKNMPGAGEYRGTEAILDTFLIPIRKSFAGSDPQNEILSIAANGSTVLLETHGTGALADGRPYDNRYAWAIELRDGKVAEVREYMDSAYIVDLFGMRDA